MKFPKLMHLTLVPSIKSEVNAEKHFEESCDKNESIFHLDEQFDHMTYGGVSSF